VKELSYCLGALSDPSRFRIIHELAMHGETKVSDLADIVRVSQPLLSWHLRKLRRAGLIITRKDGRQVLCSLDRAQLRQCGTALAVLAGPSNLAELPDTS
jgi:ArsR family transcriptional regulator